MEVLDMNNERRISSKADLFLWTFRFKIVFMKNTMVSL
jgi:hypothetical protein